VKSIDFYRLASDIFETDDNNDLEFKAGEEGEDTKTRNEEFTPTMKKILTMIYYGLLLSTGMAGEFHFDSCFWSLMDLDSIFCGHNSGGSGTQHWDDGGSCRICIHCQRNRLPLWIDGGWKSFGE
jgi:hypothetical protein